METYYSRHREELLAKQKIYNNRPEVQEKLKAYRRQYWQAHKLPPPSTQVTDLLEAVKARTTDLRGTSTHKRCSKKGGRPPKPYFETSKDPEEVLYGMSGYKYGRILKNCTQGIYERPVGENPFFVSFK